MRSYFDDLGTLGSAYETVDWAATPLGPVASWSEALVATVDLMAQTRFPVTLMWGPELVLVYNEAFVPLIADKHPGALGTPARDVFPEAWPLIGPMLHGVLDGNDATWVEDEYVPLHRRGFLEECYFTFSYSPVRGRGNRVEGVMDIAAETTEEVLSRRRLQLLSRLNERLAHVELPEEIRDNALPLLRAVAHDFPEADIRLSTVGGAATGPAPDDPAEVVDLGYGVLETRGDRRVARLPLSSSDAGEQCLLVVTLSPFLALDDDYLGFLRLVAATLREALERVRVRSAERHMAEVQRGMSEAFQRSLLPRFIRSQRPEVAVRYQPAVELAQIGGDWYDLFELSDGSLTVVIGDVAGHDQQAAAAMAQVRNMLRGVASTMHPDVPGQVLRGVDRVMLATAQDIVATAVLAQVSGDGRGPLTLRWSNAGHPPPVLIEPDGRTRLLEDAPDLLLGVDAGTSRGDHCVTLPPGTTVVLYTDGLIERRGVPVAEGLAWIVEVLWDCHRMGVEELCDHLLRSSVAAEDDIALLVLRA